MGTDGLIVLYEPLMVDIESRRDSKQLSTKWVILTWGGMLDICEVAMCKPRDNIGIGSNIVRCIHALLMGGEVLFDKQAESNDIILSEIQALHRRRR